MRFVLPRNWLALVAGLFLLGCKPAVEAGCAPATNRERVYPFTGEWGTAEDRLLCLVQSDVQTITGRLNGYPLVGIVRPDGSFIFTTQEKPLAIYVAWLNTDMLVVEHVVSAETGPYPGTGPWRRGVDPRR